MRTDKKVAILASLEQPGTAVLWIAAPSCRWISADGDSPDSESLDRPPKLASAVRACLSGVREALRAPRSPKWQRANWKCDVHPTLRRGAERAPARVHGARVYAILVREANRSGRVISTENAETERWCAVAPLLRTDWRAATRGSVADDIRCKGASATRHPGNRVGWRGRGGGLRRILLQLELVLAVERIRGVVWRADAGRSAEVINAWVDGHSHTSSSTQLSADWHGTGKREECSRGAYAGLNEG